MNIIASLKLQHYTTHHLFACFYCNIMSSNSNHFNYFNHVELMPIRNSTNDSTIIGVLTIPYYSDKEIDTVCERYAMGLLANQNYETSDFAPFSKDKRLTLVYSGEGNIVQNVTSHLINLMKTDHEQSKYEIAWNYSSVIVESASDIRSFNGGLCFHFHLVNTVIPYDNSVPFLTCQFDFYLVSKNARKISTAKATTFVTGEVMTLKEIMEKKREQSLFLPFDVDVDVKEHVRDEKMSNVDLNNIPFSFPNVLIAVLTLYIMFLHVYIMF